MRITSLVPALVPALLVLMSLTGHAQAPLPVPMDEASVDLELAALRDRALAAVRTRNAAALAELADPGDGLRQRIRRIHPEDHSTWQVAETALAHGGRFLVATSGETFFCAPWAVASPYFVDTPDNLVGPEGLGPVAILETTRVFASRRLAGPPLASVPPGYLRVLEEVMSSDEAVAVQLSDGRRGWAARSSLWTDWDDPVCFGMRNGVWWLVRIAGWTPPMDIPC